MKVKELIKGLKSMPPDAEVVISGDPQLLAVGSEIVNERDAPRVNNVSEGSEGYVVVWPDREI